MSSERLFSLVIPVRNEQLVLPSTYTTLSPLLAGIGMPFEVIVVDNGSDDATPEIMADICRRDQAWKYIRLSRNFEYQNSITAGMLAAAGDAIMVIDSDLQDPPELIPTFIAKWQEGYDIVYGVRSERTGESKVRIAATMTAMRFITWMSDDVKLPLHSGDFRLISRRARDAFARLPESNRYVRGMIHWLGFRQIGIPYTRRGRKIGRSNNSALFLIGFTLNAVFNSSVKPLRMFGLLGLAIMGLTSLLACVYVVMSFLTNPPPGITTVLILLLGNLGLTSLGIGILGEYVAKIYAEGKRRPLWLVDYSINVQPPALPGTGGSPPGPGGFPGSYAAAIPFPAAKSA